MSADTFSEYGINVPSILKDPDAVLDYTFDWTDWLSAISDTLATKTVTGSGVVVDSSGLSGALVVVWVSGGTPGSVATVTCKITTVGGRTEERTIYLNIAER